VALLDGHIHCLNSELNHTYLASIDVLERHQITLAGFANLLLWLCWLRSSKCFGLTWQDLQVMEPEDIAITMNLPIGCGMVSGHLDPETKSAHCHRPDVPMMYKSLSGLHLGKWFHCAQHACCVGCPSISVGTFYILCFTTSALLAIPTYAPLMDPPATALMPSFGLFTATVAAFATKSLSFFSPSVIIVKEFNC
jgi:hypothetical protein